jgi:hypothetical protein
MSSEVQLEHDPRRRRDRDHESENKPVVVRFGLRWNNRRRPSKHATEKVSGDPERQISCEESHVNEGKTQRRHEGEKDPNKHVDVAIEKIKVSLHECPVSIPSASASIGLVKDIGY